MQFYDCVTANLGTQWGVDNGWSAPYKFVLAMLENLDLSKVGISGGDYKQKELQQELHKEANLHRLCLITKEHMEGKTILFTPSVFSAKGAAHYLQHNYGISAAYVHGKQDEEERRDVLAAYRAGDIQVLVNCVVCAVGFDQPDTKTVILGRPTRSRTFYLQVVGRANRVLPGTVDEPGLTKEKRLERIAESGKPYFKIVDCTDATLDHNLITAPDMFCDFSKKEKRIANEISCQSEAALTPEELSELTRKEAERRAKAELIEAMRENATGKARGEVSGVDYDINKSGKRSVGTYRNPLKGKHSGKQLSELPKSYLEWGANNPTLTGWIKGLYRKELGRRHDKFRTAG